ncbi:MAG TPA: GspH/FimT family pseudopilin [Steroidobacteraceae bacterium]|nr:GspH/FimT family pseudopilin [Steroidobacteraceae bacterium]
MCKAAGTTLLEVLMALAVIAVLTTLAAPSLQSLHWNSRRTAAVNGFLHTIFLARSEAITRAQIVSVCHSSDGQQCGAGADWNTGWIVFVNSDRDDPPARDAAEPLLLSSAGWPGMSITSNRRAYSFRPVTQAVVNGTIVFCDARGSAEARAIIISHTGRPRVAQRDAAGKPLRCASG